MSKYKIQQIGLLVSWVALIIVGLVTFFETSNTYMQMETNRLLWVTFMLLIYISALVYYTWLVNKWINELGTKIKRLQTIKDGNILEINKMTNK